MELKYDYESQAIEAARKLIEILKKQIESGIPDEQKMRKQNLIMQITQLYDLDDV